jgi:hypothetical protein
MMGRFEQRCADLFVAPGAKLQLGRLGQKFQIPAVNLMAINASQLGFIVLAAVPQGDISPGVAGQTDRILVCGGPFFREVHQAAHTPATAAAHVV